SEVKAHLGGQAREASQALGAEAYATGHHIAFAKTPTLHTAAHEAAHIVQQRAGVSLKDGIGESGDRYERHADEVADAVVRGQSAEGILDRMTGASSTAQALQREEGEGEGELDAASETDEERAALERELIDVIGTHFKGGYGIDMSTMDINGIPLLTLYAESSNTTWPDGVTGIEFDKFLGFGCILSAAHQIEEALLRLAGGDAANWRRAALILVNRVNTELTRFGVAAAWGGLIGGGGVLTFLKHDAATSYQPTPDDPQSITLYASELAKLAQDFDELVPDISRAVSVGLEELDGVYELTLPGRTGIWVKDGEDAVFIAAEQAKREEDLAALNRLYDNAFSAEAAGNRIDAEHSFAAWASELLGGVDRPDVNLAVQALNALASANGAVMAMSEAKAAGVVPWVESLYVASDAIGGAAGAVYNYASRIEEWRAGMLAGAEEGLALARSIRDHALSFVATAGVAMATPALAGFLRVSQPVANFLLTGAAEIAKGVIIEGSEKDGDWERIDVIKIGKDAMVAMAANALSAPIKQRMPAWARQNGFPTLATQRSVDSLGTAIEGAIMDSIQIYRGQSIPYDVFMQNIARNLVAGAVSSQ
ncbi:MAG TPA: DUF4157 domain-containing protein, partial [Myxococcota bacterium]|nr:DUF4157 domain-containing protein [Myxococcota bacterium]